MTTSPARPDELAAAFTFLYGPAAADTHIGHALSLVARGELNRDDILVARAGDALAGAVFCQRLPGSVAVIWPPRAVGEDPAVEDALTAAALAHVAGVQLVQAFLPPEEAGRAGPLLRAGFRRVTRVWQMEHTSGPPLPRSGGAWMRGGLGVRGSTGAGGLAGSGSSTAAPHSAVPTRKSVSPTRKTGFRPYTSASLP